MRKHSASLVSALLAALPLPALAQAYQCAVPQRLAVGAAPRPDGPVRRTAIGRYTLAASWSPEYCRSNRDPRSTQCSGRNGRFGFILHGLWPEAARGAAPQWCALNPRPSPALLRQHLCMTPSASLLEHEWAKHGSCMARSPAGYFQTGAKLWRGLRWPDLDRLSRQQDLTVGDLRRELAVANPAFPANGIAVSLSRNGWLREVKLCYSARLQPAACQRSALGPRDSAPLKIWRGL